MIKISIVIPVFNGEHTIERAIGSCFSQTVQPFEVIVIDDCSEDSTAEICLDYGSKIIYIKQIINVGPAACRNLGIRHSTGDWVCFLDSDDFFHDLKLETLGRFLLEVPNATFVGHQFFLEPDRNKELQLSQSGFLPFYKCALWSVLLRNPVVTPSLCIRRDRLLEFDENFKFCEDYDFVLRTVERDTFHILQVRLVALGRVPSTVGGLSANLWGMRCGEVRVYREFCRRKSLPLIVFAMFGFFSVVKHLISKVRSVIAPKKYRAY